MFVNLLLTDFHCNCTVLDQIGAEYPHFLVDSDFLACWRVSILPLSHGLRRFTDFRLFTHACLENAQLDGSFYLFFLHLLKLLSLCWHEGWNSRFEDLPRRSICCLGRHYSVCDLMDVQTDLLHACSIGRGAFIRRDPLSKGKSDRMVSSRLDFDWFVDHGGECARGKLLCDW